MERPSSTESAWRGIFRPFGVIGFVGLAIGAIYLVYARVQRQRQMVTTLSLFFFFSIALTACGIILLLLNSLLAS
jgi:hypothetical protein